MNSIETLAAIQARLEGDSALTALVPAARIANFLPQKVAYPHIFYQLDDETMAIKLDPDVNITLQIDIWSDKSSLKEILQVRDALYNALHDKPLTLSTNDNYGIYYQRLDSDLEPDGATYRGTVTFNLLVGDA